MKTKLLLALILTGLVAVAVAEIPPAPPGWHIVTKSEDNYVMDYNTPSTEAAALTNLAAAHFDDLSDFSDEYLERKAAVGAYGYTVTESDEKTWLPIDWPYWHASGKITAQWYEPDN